MTVRTTGMTVVAITARIVIVVNSVSVEFVQIDGKPDNRKPC